MEKRYFTIRGYGNGAATARATSRTWAVRYANEHVRSLSQHQRCTSDLVPVLAFDESAAWAELSEGDWAEILARSLKKAQRHCEERCGPVTADTAATPEYAVVDEAGVSLNITLLTDRDCGTAEQELLRSLREAIEGDPLIVAKRRVAPVTEDCSASEERSPYMTPAIPMLLGTMLILGVLVAFAIAKHGTVSAPKTVMSHSITRLPSGEELLITDEDDPRVMVRRPGEGTFENEEGNSYRVSDLSFTKKNGVTMSLRLYRVADNEDEPKGGQ